MWFQSQLGSLDTIVIPNNNGNNAVKAIIARRKAVQGSQFCSSLLFLNKENFPDHISPHETHLKRMKLSRHTARNYKRIPTPLLHTNKNLYARQAQPLLSLSWLVLTQNMSSHGDLIFSEDRVEGEFAFYY